MEIGALLIGIIPGVISCFFGLKLQRIVLAITWVIVGFYLMNAILSPMTIDPNFALVLKIGAGLILGAFSMKLQKIGWFILLFVLGFMIVYTTTSPIWYNYLLGIVVGAILGILATFLYEPMIIISSSLVGAYSIVSSIIQYFHIETATYTIVLFIVIALLGLITQFSNFRKIKT